ncbi:hypothetical protein SSABA_v1c01850 [Spiroplasma sabaudiense Ar-1343]|uniref:Transmembrane protein n=1 Tax=Spiroplasma sabaudiense Ar-1343 TaxID=1276257 RepID=W6A996_9MOLU|nr:hypothetical protein [Spiroplasma sabaudiense]AHI53597.1 hypothetical protein SSABA_v1c01850 [Spiroplasma sabaudiense Ar-1343]
MLIFYQKLCTPAVALLIIENIILFCLIIVNNERIERTNKYYKKDLAMYRIKLKFTERGNYFKTKYLFFLVIMTCTFSLSLLLTLFVYYKSNIEVKKWAYLILWTYIYFLIIKIYFDPDTLFIGSESYFKASDVMSNLKTLSYNFKIKNDLDLNKIEKSEINKILIKYTNDLNHLIKNRNICLKKIKKRGFENDLIYDNFIKFLFRKQNQIESIEKLWNQNIKKPDSANILIGPNIIDIKAALLEATIEKYFAIEKS